MSTTTTLVDYPDTQMLDYAPDGDFSMQNSPAEWLAVEATMLDDDPISAATEYSETIEVDMEPHDEHDGEITEYEMTDDVPADVDYDGDARLLDVDVEVEHSPPSLQSVPDILIASEAGIVEQHPMTPPAHYLSSPALADVSVVMTESPSFHDVAVLTPLPETEARFSVTSPQHVHDESALAPVAELNSATPGTSHSPILPGDYPAAQAQSDTPAAATADASVDSAYQQTENVENPIANEPVEYQAASVPAEPNAANEAQQPREQHDIQHEEHKAATSIASGADAAGDHSVAAENPDALAPEAAEPTEEVPEEGDPHEISEGVYIDPPPAVLLSIASIATGDVCLFNHPPSKSRSQSPGESSTANSSTTLVLHEQPTLYYESLAQVFVALRQEQIVYSSAELVDNELILEAYDLNLTVGEDNVYAAQVTIHDLNEIHDRLGLTGPLRLRLTSGSRFITRYQALREQIAQIALGTDEQQPETEQLQVSAETAEEQPRSAVPSVSDAHENESDEVNDAQDEVAQEVAAEEHHPAEGATTESQEDAQGEQVAQEYPDNGPTDGLVEQNQDSDRYENPENNDAVGDRGLELTVAPAVQELDADEVHRSADAEEGGDYATLETFPDDDDKFGEALPEELGGEAPANETEQLDEETSQEGTDEASTDPETAVKGSEDNNDEYDESEENIDPVVVRADEVLLAPENEDDADDATAHGSSENSEEAEQLYDYDDADGEHFTQENYEQEEWDELEDPDADQTLADDAASSKQSSETLSTLSKRSRDDDDDGYEEEDVEGSAAGSPGSKRIRTH